jgi:RNA polymerase sigma-70 factor (ECF subfamily)
VPAALEALRTLLRPQVAAAARRVGAVGAEELEAQLLERLLVAPPGQRPRLASYEGRAPLAAWLKVAAVRLALNQQRNAPPEEAADAEALAARAAATDVELEVLLARHRADVQQAVSTALAALAPRERTLLRLHVREGVSLERLGTMYGVHKSSVSRWLAAAQARVREDTRRHLCARLGLAPASLESLLGAVGGQLEMCLSLTRE